MPPKLSKKKSTPRTGASHRDLETMARNAKHATNLLDVGTYNQAPNSFKILNMISRRMKENNVHTGDRNKWHIMAQLDRDKIEAIGQGEVSRVTKELDDLKRQCSVRSKALQKVKRSLPRPRRSKS